MSVYMRRLSLLCCFLGAACVGAPVDSDRNEDGDILPGKAAPEEIAGQLMEAASNGPCNPTCNPAECGGSPIVIDMAGNGFDLSDATHGVNFDLRADGSPERWSWTKAGSDDAWLALPGDDGKVTNGRELFGNYTPQAEPPPGFGRNGFNALAAYDYDHNGVIDAHDHVFGRLRLWRDVNHDGVSQPGELYTMASAGIVSFSLVYVTSPRIDGNGNAFSYQGSLTRVAGAMVNRIVYDVFLSTLAQTAVNRLVNMKAPERDEDGTIREAQTCDPPPGTWQCDGLDYLGQLGDPPTTACSSTSQGPTYPYRLPAAGFGSSQSAACADAKSNIIDRTMQLLPNCYTIPDSWTVPNLGQHNPQCVSCKQF